MITYDGVLFSLHNIAVAKRQRITRMSLSLCLSDIIMDSDLRQYLFRIIFRFSCTTSRLNLKSVNRFFFFHTLAKSLTAYIIVVVVVAACI
jgi:hypothetical protein